ncbi:mannose-6-phosphate isomerase, class I [Cellulosimicrobium arenosum]|uniref:mannose-6-phosphate isomerase n=1 Tax=Cellulosimicrobium arenosum TaxID=2708133 RepID=A0A927IZZ6_9MICO|nr:mannose-6-phosphate isomerase, class I [Cellulosimicrobium arenosum]MBD8079042.1 mannose-6-phosphate isomerase, class I [Cellulosimicrobium arenosum]
MPNTAEDAPGAGTAPFSLLHNTIQRYDWGSRAAIQELLGLDADGRPAAELWMGAHPLAPSRVCAPGEAAGSGRPQDGARGTTLVDLIRADPLAVLGRRVLDEYGPRLPYLFKVLAAERALSLQVHPHPHRARAGFNRENRSGVPRDSPARSFHDDQHKPEMVVALTPFEGLSGFRRPVRLLRLLEGLDGDLAARMRAAVAARPTEAGLREAFALALHARTSPDVAADLARSVASVRARHEAGLSPSVRGDVTVLVLAEQHPGDPGALVSLMLNRVSLAPGESMFVPSGHVHAYLSGCAVEVMASSDNVLRAGLTSKLVDVDALLECATCAPGPAARPRVVTDAASGTVTYRPPVAEFALQTSVVGAGETVTLPDAGPRLVLCLEGEPVLAAAAPSAGQALQPMRRGGSVFVPHAAGALTARGPGRLVVAYVP